MRVIAYMITCVFVFLCAKVGWKCNNLKEFTLDSTWAYLLAAAMGSKALQSFSENRLLTAPTPNITASGFPSPPIRANSGPDAGIATSNMASGHQLPPPPLQQPSLVQKKLNQ